MTVCDVCLRAAPCVPVPCSLRGARDHACHACVVAACEAEGREDPVAAADRLWAAWGEATGGDWYEWVDDVIRGLADAANDADERAERDEREDEGPPSARSLGVQLGAEVLP